MVAVAQGLEGPWTRHEVIDASKRRPAHYEPGGDPMRSCDLAPRLGWSLRAADPYVLRRGGEAAACPVRPTWPSNRRGSPAHRRARRGGSQCTIRGLSRVFLWSSRLMRISGCSPAAQAMHPHPARQESPDCAGLGHLPAGGPGSVQPPAAIIERGYHPDQLRLTTTELRVWRRRPVQRICTSAVIVIGVVTLSPYWADQSSRRPKARSEPRQQSTRHGLRGRCPGSRCAWLVSSRPRRPGHQLAVDGALGMGYGATRHSLPSWPD